MAFVEAGSSVLTPLIFSCSRLSLDETSEGAVSNVKSTLEEGNTPTETWMMFFETLLPRAHLDTPPMYDRTLVNAKSTAPDADKV